MRPTFFANLLSNPPRRSVRLQHLPNEVLLKIFTFVIGDNNIQIRSNGGPIIGIPYQGLRLVAEADWIGLAGTSKWCRAVLSRIINVNPFAILEPVIASPANDGN